MNRETYYYGNGKKWGIYNTRSKKFQFGICEDTPMLAEARLFQKIGGDARKHRFEAKEIVKSSPVEIGGFETVKTKYSIGDVVYIPVRIQELNAFQRGSSPGIKIRYKARFEGRDVRCADGLVNCIEADESSLIERVEEDDEQQT